MAGSDSRKATARRMTVDAGCPAPNTKRMTLSQVLEMVLARGSSDRSSVELTRNARGDTQIAVVVRTGDNSDIPDVLAAEQRACEIYDRLAALYPRASQNGGE